MMKFLSSMRADRCIADADILVDIAHVLMLDKQKIIDREITKELILRCSNSSMGFPKRSSTTVEDVHAGSVADQAIGAEAGTDASWDAPER
jgi:argininosuccinate lyase